MSKRNLTVAAILSLAVCAGAQAVEPDKASEKDKSQSLTDTGFTYMQSKDYIGARPYFQRALELEPNLAMAHLNLGAVYQNTGDVAAATEQFNLAILNDVPANKYVPVRQTTDGKGGTVTDVANRNLKRMQQQAPVKTGMAPPQGAAFLTTSIQPQ